MSSASNGKPMDLQNHKIVGIHDFVKFFAKYGIRCHLCEKSAKLVKTEFSLEMETEFDKRRNQKYEIIGRENYAFEELKK